MVVRSVVALTVGIAALAGCSQAPQLSVSDAWVRLAAVPGRPAAGYFTLHGGPTDATLISVATDVAVRTEMHEMKAGVGGAMTMDAVQQLRVPATQTVRFAPGGKHLMLFDLNPSVKPGGKLTFTFTFADGVRIQQPASVIAAGDPAPKE